MKKIMKLVMITMFFIFVGVGCGKVDTTIDNGTTITPTTSISDPTIEDTSSEFEAEVVEGGESLLVTPQQDSNEFRSSDRIVVNGMDLTTVWEGGKELDRKDLKAGDIIKITYNGVILESYPAQISAVKVERIGHNILIDGYLALIDNIYRQDNGLNGDITMIALDTVDWVGLTDIEKEIIFAKMKESYKVDITQATYEELVEQGLVDGENLLFEKGILITVNKMKYDEEKGKITCAIKKWRSGLGAIGSEDVTAKYKSGEWNITMEGMWIS